MKRIWFLLPMLFIAVASPSSAATTDIAHSGGWRAYTGNSEDGTPICGMAANAAGNRGFHIKYYYGSPGLTVQIFKKSWRIPNRTPVEVTVGFDREEIGHATGRGYTLRNDSGGMVEFAIQKDSPVFNEFLREFKDAVKMWVSFPSGNETTWWADMTGSRDIGTAFESCIVTMVNRLSPAQSYGNAPTQPYNSAAPTQPYGNAPLSLPPAPPKTTPVRKDHNSI